MSATEPLYSVTQLARAFTRSWVQVSTDRVIVILPFSIFLNDLDQVKVYVYNWACTSYLVWKEDKSKEIVCFSNIFFVCQVPQEGQFS